LDLRGWAGFKLALGTILVIGAGIFLAPPPPPEQTHPKRIPVKFWHMWTAEWQPVVEGICARFNASQDKYEVIPLSIPSTGSIEKFLMSSAGGSPPDLVSQWNPVLGMWVERGLVQPVENYMTPEERERFRREAFPIMKKYAIYHGKITAVIAGVDVGAVFYRLSDLNEIGVDKNHLPRTLEDLVALGKRLDKRDKQGNLQRIGFSVSGYENYVPSFGGTFNEGDQMVFDTPQDRAALRFVVAQDKRLGFQDVIRFQASQPADTGVTIPILSGNFSILLDGQWRVKTIKDYAPSLDYAVTPLPPPKGGEINASFTGANYMLIPTGAKHPEGAMAFLRYWVGMTDAEAGGRNVASMGWLPYCPRVEKSKTYQAYLANYSHYQTFVDLVKSPNLDIPPQGPLQSFAMDQLQSTNDLTSRGTLSADAAIDLLTKNMADEYKRQEKLGNVR
jgi:multiple sugar transport system substrate-binding protein